MARKIILITSIITLVWLPRCFAAASDNNAVGPQTSETISGIARPKVKVDVVTMVDFYLRDGNTVSGRLLSEDNAQVVVEMPSDTNSTLVIKTYSKREIDTRTLRTHPVPESRYYTQLGEYFAARTWDFKDDPDDFIQAIRCYEKAKQSLQGAGAEPDKLAEMDKAIKKLQDDREVWTKEVESRAKLKKLEYDAEAENRLKQLEKQIAESNVRLNESIKYLDKTAEDIKNDYKNVQKTISDLNKDFVQQINNLQARIANDEIAINELWLRLQIVGRPPGGGGK
jgi:hypothetical protein